MAIAESLTEIKGEVKEFLNSDCREVFDKLSESGKDLISSVYEHLYEIPVANRVVGKLEIAYNQFWIDKYEKKANKSSEDIIELNSKINVLDSSRDGLRSIYDTLYKEKATNLESINAKVTEIDMRQNALLDKRDRIQMKLEYREGMKNQYIERRNGIADKLIGYYNERLKPLNEKIEELNTFREDRRNAMKEAKLSIEENNGRIETFKEQGELLKKVLKTSGMSDREIIRFEATKVIDREMLEMRNMNFDLERTIRKDEQKAIKIGDKIVKINVKADPYRMKIKEFENIKERQRTPKTIVTEESKVQDEEVKNDIDKDLNSNGGDLENVKKKKQRMERNSTVVINLEEALTHFGMSHLYFDTLTKDEQLSILEAYRILKPKSLEL